MRILSRFGKSTGANVALLFGLSAIPMIGVGGMAIDYIGAANAKSSIQQAADDAVLAAGAATEDLTDAELKTLVTNFLARNGSDQILDEIINIDVVTTPDDRITVTVSGNINAKFMGLIGYSKLDVEVTSVVKRGFGNLEVALVLDNTNSMNADGKLDALKNSANLLIGELFDKKGPSTTLKVGVVPFSKYVNVGLSNRNAPWLDVADDSTVVTTGTRDVYGQVPGSERNCGDRTYDSNNDGITTTNTYYACDYDYAVTGTEPYTSTTSSIWNGCVGSRNYPLNVEDRDPAARIPGIMESNSTASCPRPLTPLTQTRATVESEITALTATNETYLPAGLMWGWRLLSNAAPFNQGVTYNAMANESYTKAIVLMTDGVNTQIPLYPGHANDGGNATTTNTLTAELCENIKNSGSNDQQRIKIYTVTFTVTDPVVKDLLRNCATDADSYFDAGDQSALAAAFKTIGKSLANLALAR